MLSIVKRERNLTDETGSLALKYVSGEGVPKDYKEVVKWLRLAADKGYSKAQNALGQMYYEGEGVPQDYEEAVKWYRLAAGQGNGDAQEAPKKLGIDWKK